MRKAVEKNRRKKYVCLVLGLAVAMLGGCATYHRMPLEDSAIARKLQPPSMDDIRVQAKTIRHPILKPVQFNERDGLSADEAGILAVLANPELRAARDRKGLAAAQLFQAGILPNPQISYSLDVPTGGSTNGTVNAFGLGLGWDISSLISRGTRLHAARKHAASVDLQVAWQEWQVAQAARLHVYRLLCIQKQLVLAGKTERQLEENLQTLKKAFSMGVKTILELNAAKVSCQNAHNTVLTLAQEQLRERHGLNRTLGLPPGQVVSLQRNTRLPLWQHLPGYREIVQGLASRRLDLLALKKGYASQEAQVRAAILSQFPRINIGLNHARDTGNTVTTGFAISVDLPFFDRNQGQIAMARADRKQLFDEYMARMFAARSRVAAILGDMASVKKQLDAAKHSVNIASQLVKTYNQALKEGNADVVTYSNLRNELETRRLVVLKLKRDLTDMGIALEIAAAQYLH
jgi:outer membrane protein, heavy metal efflux system